MRGGGYGGLWRGVLEGGEEGEVSLWGGGVRVGGRKFVGMKGLFWDGPGGEAKMVGSKELLKV